MRYYWFGRTRCNARARFLNKLLCVGDWYWQAILFWRFSFETSFCFALGVTAFRALNGWFVICSDCLIWAWFCYAWLNFCSISSFISLLEGRSSVYRLIIYEFLVPRTKNSRSFPYQGMNRRKYPHKNIPQRPIIRNIQGKFVSWRFVSVQRRNAIRSRTCNTSDNVDFLRQ